LHCGTSIVFFDREIQRKGRSEEDKILTLLLQ